jgi:hypothetical protein
MGPSGDCVVAWTSSGQYGNFTSVFARRYDSLANPLGGEFHVNDFTTISEAT